MHQKSSQALTAVRDRSTLTYGVIIVGNMTSTGDRGLRIAQEIRHHAATGVKVGLVQAVRPGEGTRVTPEIQTCVRRGLATVIPLPGAPETELLVVHAPSEIDWTGRHLGAIRARRATMVCYRTEDFAVKRLRQRLKGGAKLAWAPVNRWVRATAPRQLALTEDDWHPRLLSAQTAPRPRNTQAAQTIGWISTPGSAPPPPATAGLNVLVLDMNEEPTFSLDRLDRLDGIAYFPVPDEPALPDTLIRAALSLKMKVALPEWLEPHYGTGPSYCQFEEAATILAAPRAGSSTRSARHRKNVASLGEEPRPVMFLASNGVGIGHVSRLAAIARRVEPRCPILFVTQAQAVGAVERLGYLTEYMPSASYVGGDFEAWDKWFRFELEALMDTYDPALVVYDGNNPSNGLVRAVATRRDCRLAWVRRALWGNLTSPFIDNSRWFDLIIEPGELEGQPDNGVTAMRRDEATLVAPIRLLDESELLSRADAAKALGLDPSRPAALIQLGAGYNRDVVGLLDQLIGVLRPVPRLQICIAEWVNGAHPLNYWPDITYIRGYPLSQYFRAFDFSIAAAGYNTFHEVIRFDLPTIFIPNRHPSMDDQAGRAAHAQALQACFELDEGELDDLPDLVALLMETKARDFLTGNSRKLHRSNGAGEAALALTELLEVSAP